MSTMPKQHARGGVLSRAVRGYLDDDMLTYSAALAYQVLFALFPFIIFLVSLLGFLNLEEFFTWLQEQANVLLPEQAMSLVNRVIDEIQQRQGGILSFSVFVALWSASGGMRSLMNALNQAYNVEEDRPAWKRFLLSIVYTVGLAALLMVAAGLMLIGPEILERIAAPLGLGPEIINLWGWLRWPVAVAMLMIAVSAVYALCPATSQPFRLLAPGAVLAVIIWVAATFGYSFYVQRIGNYNATYGSLGAVVMLIFYFYLSAAVLLFGAEINAAQMPQTSHTEHDDSQETENTIRPRERAVGQDGKTVHMR